MSAPGKKGRRKGTVPFFDVALPSRLVRRSGRRGGQYAFFCPFFLLLVLACHGQQVQQIAPAVAVDATARDFGAVRVGTTVTLSIDVQSVSKADLMVGATVTGDGFTVMSAPSTVTGLGSDSVVLAFSPAAAMPYAGMLTLTTNDMMHPSLDIPLAGHGAFGALAVTAICNPAAHCEAMVMNGPPGITFAPEPFVRLEPVVPSALPALTLRSAGEVPVVLEQLAISGGAFSWVGNATVPDGGLSLAPDASVTLPLRFTPTSDTQLAYAGAAAITTDVSTVMVPLSGQLRPNLPPRVCFNLVQVVPADGSPPRNYPSDGSPPPDGGYDFTATRDVPPRAELQLSALSDPNDESTCTYDPDDGRLGLTWQWQILSQPSGSTPVALAGADTPVVSLRAFAVGRYVVQLTVTDSEMNSTTALGAFTVALKSDLLVQLEWGGFAGVDLDLHLIRPGAAPFSPGDLNGYSLTATPDAGDFDWGLPGPLDDPHLNIDDTGSGPLLENISLDKPENDPACAGAPCVYQVQVHYFRDARMHASLPACAVSGGCHDGETCNCAGADVCVASSAPIGSAASGAGVCLPPVNPVVRLFFRGATTPAQEIPLPPGVLTLGAPCELMHVADVVWQARGSDGGIGVADAGAAITRYGFRQAGNLQCAPDTTRSGRPWYGLEP
jgi:hypothetical protein